MYLINKQKDKKLDIHIHKQKDTTSHRQSIYICTLNLLVEEYTKSLTINVDRMRTPMDWVNALYWCWPLTVF